MEMTPEKILTECSMVYPYTEKRIEHAKKQMDEVEFEFYLKEGIDLKFYTLINEMIICLQNDKPMIQQRFEMSEQLRGMTEFYFEKLPSINPFVSINDFWKGTSFELVGKESIYIKPKYFTKEIVFKIVERLTSENHIKKIKKDEEQDWYLVAFEFANGNIYESKKIGSIKIAKDIFPQIIDKKRLETLSTYIRQTKNDNEDKYKNIFKRNNAKEELQRVINDCIDKGIKIHPLFLKRYDLMIYEDSLK